MLNDRTEDQSPPPPPPPPARAVQSLCSLLMFFAVLQGIVDYLVLRGLYGVADAVGGLPYACVAVGGNGTVG